MPFVLPLLNYAPSGVCLFESATDFTSKNILTLFWQTLDSWFNQSENFFFWYSSRSKCEVKPLCDDLSWSVVERFLGAISIFCRGDSLASPKTLSLWWHWLMSRERYFQPVFRTMFQAFGLFIGGLDNRNRGRESLSLFLCRYCRYSLWRTCASEFCSNFPVRIAFQRRRIAFSCVSTQLSARKLEQNSLARRSPPQSKLGRSWDIARKTVWKYLCLLISQCPHKLTVLGDARSKSASAEVWRSQRETVLRLLNSSHRIGLQTPQIGRWEETSEKTSKPIEPRGRGN